MIKPDLYSRIILTIIAICLVVIAFRPFASPRAAHAYVSSDVVNVNIEQVGGHAIVTDYRGALPVQVISP